MAISDRTKNYLVAGLADRVAADEVETALNRPAGLTETSDDIAIHVSKTGTRAGTGSVNDPVDSLKTAVERLPNKIKHQVYIVFGEGEFPCDDVVFDQTMVSSGRITVYGALQRPAELSSGQNTGVVHADSMSFNVDCPGAGWTPGDLVGKFIQFNDGRIVPIVANTEEQLVTCNGVAMDALRAYRNLPFTIWENTTTLAVTKNSTSAAITNAGQSGFLDLMEVDIVDRTGHGASMAVRILGAYRTSLFNVSIKDFRYTNILAYNTHYLYLYRTYISQPANATYTGGAVYGIQVGRLTIYESGVNVSDANAIGVYARSSIIENPGTGSGCVLRGGKVGMVLDSSSTAGFSGNLYCAGQSQAGLQIRGAFSSGIRSFRFENCGVGIQNDPIYDGHAYPLFGGPLVVSPVQMYANNCGSAVKLSSPYTSVSLTRVADIKNCTGIAINVGAHPSASHCNVFVLDSPDVTFTDNAGDISLDGTTTISYADAKIAGVTVDQDRLSRVAVLPATP